jgi:hypothetical protein
MHPGHVSTRPHPLHHNSDRLNVSMPASQPTNARPINAGTAVESGIDYPFLGLGTASRSPVHCTKSCRRSMALPYSSSEYPTSQNQPS